MAPSDDDLDAIRDRMREEILEEATRRTPDEPVHLSGGTFPAFVRDHPVAVVDVRADWCGPCRRLAPILEELAAELDDVAIGKLDADAHPDLVRRLDVQGLPTLLIYRDGEPADRIVGVQPKATLARRFRGER